MKARILSLLSVLLAVFWISSTSYAQPIITTAGTMQACPGSTVSIPITVTNFATVASASLTLGYNTEVLTFINYSANPLLAAGGFTILCNAANGQVKIAFFGLSEMTLTSSTVIFTFNFTYNGGISPLIWDTINQGNCGYSDLNGSDLSAVWMNGLVSPLHAAPTISLNPGDFSVVSGGSATFSVTGADATNLQWQESSNSGATWTDLTNGNGYTGTTTESLIINPTTLSLNNNQYRCHLSENVCNQSINSTAAKLTVTAPVNVIVVTASNVVACPGNNVDIAISGSSMNDFQSFGMKLTYDPTVLTYNNFTNMNPALGGATFTVTNTANEIQILYNNTTGPINVADGKIVDLHFTYIGGTSNLSWSTVAGECEFSNTTVGILNSTFVNGAVNPQSIAPVITGQPSNVSVSAGNTTTFSVTATNATAYQWQLSTDSAATWSNVVNGTEYNNVTTSTLSVLTPSITSNGYWFRCLVGETICNQSFLSNSAALEVTPITSTTIVTTIGNLTSCPGSTVTFPVSVTNFNGVAAFSLTLEFDTSVLSLPTLLETKFFLPGFP